MQTLDHDLVSIHVGAPPQAVYDLVADVTRMPEFSPEIVRCGWLGGATGPSVGARFAAVNKVPGRPSWTNKPVVTVAEPGRAFAFARTERFAGTVLWSYRFEPDGEGTRVSESYEVTRRQAEQLGAEWVIAHSAAALRPAGADKTVTLSNGEEITAAAVVLAGGVTYRRLGVPSVDSLVDAGVFYGAAVSEAQAMDGLDVFVLGGGNSAGQAAAYLAAAGARVSILVRGASLAASMSDYLIQELQGSPRVTVRVGTEVTGGGTDRRLDHLVIRDRSTGLASKEHADALFIFIGARPHTDWLSGVLATDPTASC